MLKQVGAGWIREGKKGQFVSLSMDVVKLETFASEKDGKFSFLMFANEKKEEGTKQPDYTIMVATEETK
jgi:hypothetical protein